MLMEEKAGRVQVFGSICVSLGTVLEMGSRREKASFRPAAGKDPVGSWMLGLEPGNEGLFPLFSLEMGLNSIVLVQIGNFLVSAQVVQQERQHGALPSVIPLSWRVITVITLAIL